MINTNEVILVDDASEFDAVVAIKYNDAVLTFETEAERSEWLENCSLEDLDFIFNTCTDDDEE